MDLIDRLGQLKSLWGFLSTGAVFFPGAAYWFNLASIKTSPLGPYYLLTAIPLGALVLLLTIILGEAISEKAGRVAAVILGLLVVPAVMAAFVSASGDCQDGEESDVDMCQQTIQIHKVGGKIITDKPSFCYCDLGGCQWGPVQRTITTNPAEYLALLYFNICIVTLVIAFTILAVQFG